MNFQDTEKEEKALKGLYDNLLQDTSEHLKSIEADARKARQGIRTRLILQSKTAKGDVSDFELWVPRHAITLVCARTGGGKTTFMADMSRRLVDSGAKGFFVTLEEPAHAIYAKLLASFSMSKHVNHSMESVTVHEAQEAIAGVSKCNDMDGFKKHIVNALRVVDANKSVDLEHIETPSVMYQPQFIADLIKYRNIKSTKPLDFVVIDFGQLMETMDADNSSSYLRLKAVMQAMKNLCGQLGIAVIMGAQLQRACAGVSVWDWEPEMIRDGSDIEQAASLIIAIGRDKEYHDKERDMAVRFLKNRNGPQRVAGMFNINFPHCHIPNRGAVPEND